MRTVVFGQLPPALYVRWQQATGEATPEHIALPADTFLEERLLTVAQRSEETRGNARLTPWQQQEARVMGAQLFYGRVFQCLTMPEIDRVLQALHDLPFQVLAPLPRLLLELREQIATGDHQPELRDLPDGRSFFDPPPA